MEPLQIIAAVMLVLGGGVVGYILGSRTHHHIRITIDPHYERVIRTSQVELRAPAITEPEGAVQKQGLPKPHRPERRKPRPVEVNGEPPDVTFE